MDDAIASATQNNGTVASLGLEHDPAPPEPPRPPKKQYPKKPYVAVYKRVYDNDDEPDGEVVKTTVIACGFDAARAKLIDDEYGKVVDGRTVRGIEFAGLSYLQGVPPILV